MKEVNAAAAWDKEYQEGKYDVDESIPFVGEIVNVLQKEGIMDGKGLYVGCGNGRNYIPLLRSGLQLTGLDISKEALTQLKAREPEAKGKLVHNDFLDVVIPNQALDYLISIQVFQHGDSDTIKKLFDKTREVLKPNGLFFLRVNSISTDIFFSNKIKETNNSGFTTTYSDGPKKGLDVHFYSEEELMQLTEGMTAIASLHEIVMQRQAPKTGQWTQWEGIWRNS